jgi:transposase
VSEFTGPATLLASLPTTNAPLTDKGYDAESLHDALADMKIGAGISSRSKRKIKIPHDRALYRKRHKIEKMFGRLKDWRRIHTRYDRCAHTFMSAIVIEAIVTFWI